MTQSLPSPKLSVLLITLQLLELSVALLLSSVLIKHVYVLFHILIVVFQNHLSLELLWKVIFLKRVQRFPQMPNSPGHTEGSEVLLLRFSRGHSSSPAPLYLGSSRGWVHTHWLLASNVKLHQLSEMHKLKPGSAMSSCPTLSKASPVPVLSPSRQDLPALGSTAAPSPRPQMPSKQTRFPLL